MAGQLYTFTTRDPGTIRDDMLRAQKNGLIARGVPSPNITPDTDEYVRAQALANELSVVEANCILKADEAMPDTAVGDALRKRAAPFGLSPRAAAGSVGPVIFATSAQTLVSAGALLTDSSNQIYQVVYGGSFNNGDTITVAAVLPAGATTGSKTNHAAGDVLRWQTAPTFASPQVVVGAGGLVNGTDAEDDESFRQRFFGILQVPPNAGGNWQFFALAAEASSPSVAKGFVFPALQGGATLHVAVVAAPTTTNKNRDVAASTMSGIVAPYVTGVAPDHAAITVTTVANVPVDIAFQLSLPDSPNASPPGPGGGWLDGTPWPITDGTNGVYVVSAISNTQLVVAHAGAAPNPGVSRIAWLSPLNWQLYTATVLTSSFNSGQYTITIDTPFVGIAAGNFIFPQSVNQNTYVAAVLAAFQLMGPGEKSNSPSALVRGYRHPPPVVSWPYSLGANLRKALTDSGSEVSAAEYIYRFDSASLATLTGSSGVMTPLVPGAVSSPPNIYVPRNIGFYRG